MIIQNLSIYVLQGNKIFDYYAMHTMFASVVFYQTGARLPKIGHSDADT